MPRAKSTTTLALEKIASKCGLKATYLRELHVSGMPLAPLSAALNWLENRPITEGDSSAADLRREKIKLTKAQAERADLLLEVDRGKYISRQESNDSDARIAHAVAAMLKRWENEIPALCHGMPLGKALGVYREKSRELQTMLGDLRSEFWALHPERDK